MKKDQGLLNIIISRLSCSFLGEMSRENSLPTKKLHNPLVIHIPFSQITTFFFPKKKIYILSFLFIQSSTLWYLYFWPKLNRVMDWLNPLVTRDLTASTPCLSASSICSGSKYKNSLICKMNMRCLSKKLCKKPMINHTWFVEF